MEYVTLCANGPRVSKLGFGAWGIGGDAYGPVDENVATDTLLFALEAGINFYDTSNLYGSGRSEEILGKTFKPFREKVVIATKFGILPHSGRALPQDYSLDNIRKCLEGSLKRLDTEYIDLYQFHSPTLDVFSNPEVFELLNEFKQKGYIRFLGASMRSPADAVEAIKNYQLDVVQVNFNLIDHRAIESGLTELAQKKGVGIIARTPLCFGFLTGNLKESDLAFGEKDHRRFYPIEQLKRWLKAPDLFASSFSTRSSTELAIRFCLDTSGVTTVIPGMISRAEVETNLKIERSPHLSLNEFAKIFSIYRDHLFFDPKLSYRPPK